MTPAKTVLFIGHSHLECIEAAVRKDAVENVYVLNISNLVNAAGAPIKGRAFRVLDRVKARFLKPRKLKYKALVSGIVKGLPNREPDVICLCVGGNEHNVLGMLENPTPFSLGSAAAGSAPAGAPERHFSPQQMMRDYMVERMPLELTTELFKAFPKAEKLCLNAPPPVGDWEHIKAYPKMFRAKIGDGPAPKPLRMQLYQLQSDILKRTAEASGAAFVDVGSELLDEAGFLAAEFYNTDPTHGNVAYGKAMLKHVIERV